MEIIDVCKLISPIFFWFVLYKIIKVSFKIHHNYIGKMFVSAF